MSGPSRPKRKLARRSVRNLASVEQYLQAGVVPRFIERANQIESQTHRHRKRLERGISQRRLGAEQRPQLGPVGRLCRIARKIGSNA